MTDNQSTGFDALATWFLSAFTQTTPSSSTSLARFVKGIVAPTRGLVCKTDDNESSKDEIRIKIVNRIVRRGERAAEKQMNPRVFIIFVVASDPSWT